MPRTITPLQRQRMEAAKAARKEAAERCNIRVGPYIVRRFDADNICIEPAVGDENRRECEREYYPDLIWACNALLRKRIEEKCGNDLRSILDAVKRAETEIADAVRSRPVL